VEALSLLAHVEGAPTLGSLVEVLAKSALEARAETRTAQISDSFPKPRMWAVRLSKAYNKTCRV
jgi:hypothetical protein